MNDFCLQIANEAIKESIQKNSKENFSCSPLSISILLNMLANGCKGEVQEEFLRVLGSKNIDELNEKSRGLIAVGSAGNGGGGGGPELILANGAWFEQTCGVHPSFDKILRSIFETTPVMVDFLSKGSEVVDKVNSWVKENTKGLIWKIIDLDEGTQMKCQILANALYFKGTWLDPFYSDFTRDKDFHLLNGDKLKVPFTNKHCEYFPYRSFKYVKHGFRVLKLPYRFAEGEKPGRKFSMYFFLPDEKDGLKGLIENIDSNPGFLNQEFKLDIKKIAEISIPKFKFSVSLEISNAMESLGFYLPNLQSMDLLEKNIPEEERELKILHACHIEVDEEGTWAAAVTEESDEDMSCPLYVSPPRPSRIKFIADHPFMFMIREDESGTPLFVGAVTNPSSEGE